MVNTKSRKEITLEEQTIILLQFQAEKEGRKLKNYMERILIEKANELALSEEYKNTMDTSLAQHANGTLSYFTEKEFREKTARK